MYHFVARIERRKGVRVEIFVRGKSETEDSPLTSFGSLMIRVKRLRFFLFFLGVLYLRNLVDDLLLLKKNKKDKIEGIRYFLAFDKE